MKQPIIHLLLGLLPVTTSFGQNLVGNGSFEAFSDCPNYYNQVERCIGWFRSDNGNDPEFHTEYLNACNGGMFSAPSNTWGTQAPLTGDGYMALCTMSPEIFDGYRENIYTKLLTPLETGGEYTIRVSLSHTDKSQFASNNFGVKLSTSTDFPIDNDCQLALADVVMNKTGWTTVTSTFIADQNYTHLALGNFMTDDNTTIVNACPSCPFDLFGYYVDDVCLVKSGADLCSSCGDELNPVLAIRPAPNLDLDLSPSILGAGVNEVRVSTQNARMSAIEVYDMEGRLVYTRLGISQNTTRIATNSLANGTYTLSTMCDDGSRLTGRFVIAR